MAARYVELNPVRAGLGNSPRQYRCNSVAARLRGKDDALVRVRPMIQLAPERRRFLTGVVREDDLKVLRAHEHTGRPLGDEALLASLEQSLGRILRRQKPGPKVGHKIEEINLRDSSRRASPAPGQCVTASLMSELEGRNIDSLTNVSRGGSPHNRGDL
jgi:hypothetical protein